MPFLSPSLLLDLPFDQPAANDQNQWPDCSGKKGHAAQANAACEASNLDMLGNCLQIKTGGELTFPQLDPSRRAQLFSQREQLTVEFWAKPDTITDQPQYLLRGPVTIWMQGSNLCWAIGTAAFDQIYTIAGVDDQLHHWALVLNKAADSAQLTFFKDGVEIPDQATTVSITAEQLQAMATTDLVIGAETQGWTGKLAHLRLWGMALNTTQLQDNKNRDITAHTAFKAANDIDWRLVNSDDEPSLYIHSSMPQELRIEVDNGTKETTLNIPASNKAASLTNSHFWVVFRPGTLASTLVTESSVNDFIRAINKKNSDWRVSFEKWNEQDCICFLRQNSAKELAPGERLTLCLPDIKAEPGPGSRSTQVMLKYQNLEIDSTTLSPDDHPITLDGHRAQVLNILYRPPTSFYQQPPLEVGVVGAPVILNNGQEETSLTLYIKNLKRDEDQKPSELLLGNVYTSADKEAKFILEIDQTQTGSSFVKKPFSELSVGQKFWYQGSTYTLIETEFVAVEAKDIQGRQGVLDASITKVFRLTKEGSREQISVEDLQVGNKILLEFHWPNDFFLEVVSCAPKRIRCVDKHDMPQVIKPLSSQVYVAKQQDLPIGLGDSNDLQQVNVASTYKNTNLDIQKIESLGNTLRWKVLPPKVSVQSSSAVAKENENAENKRRGFHPDETIFLTISDIKTSAPAGLDIIRLRYEDFDRYGEGVFEIPIEKSPVIPARLTQGGAGYGLALGHDPRVKAATPNAEVLDEMLSIKQIGEGDAVKIENTGGGSGLTVENTGNGSGLNIENNGSGCGLAVVQRGERLAAKFTGGRGVEIETGENNLSVTIGNRQTTTVNAEANEDPSNLELQSEPLYVRPLVYLKLDQVIHGNYLIDSSGNGYGGTIKGELRIIEDDTFGHCLQFSGKARQYVTLPASAIASGPKATFSFWAKSVLEKSVWINALEGHRRELMIHIPWEDGNVYFDCGNSSQNADRIHKEISPQEYQGWVHWAFTKDADNNGRMEIYKNGRLWHWEEDKIKHLSPSIVTLGGTDADWNANSGKMARFRSYDRVLSDTEINWQKAQDERWQELREQQLAQVEQRKEQYESQKEREALNSPIRCKTTSSAPGLGVIQRGDGLAALFKGDRGVEITGDLKVGQRIRDKTGEIMPVGAVIPFAGAIAPEGWLLCNGQRVTDAKYADLADVLGQSLPFHVPNYQAKFLIGATGWDDYALGKTGGESKVRLETKNLPEHTHEIDFDTPTAGGHGHTIRWGEGDGKGNFVDSTDYDGKHSYNATDMMWGGDHNHHIQGSTQNGGGRGNPEKHENRPPFVALNYIIKY